MAIPTETKEVDVFDANLMTNNIQRFANPSTKVILPNQVTQWLIEIGLTPKHVIESVTNSYIDKNDDDTSDYTALGELLVFINDPNTMLHRIFWRIIQAYLCTQGAQINASDSHQTIMVVFNRIGFATEAAAKLVSQGVHVHRGEVELLHSMRYDLVETVMGIIRWQWPTLAQPLIIQKEEIMSIDTMSTTVVTSHPNRVQLAQLRRRHRSTH